MDTRVCAIVGAANRKELGRFLLLDGTERLLGYLTGQSCEDVRAFRAMLCRLFGQPDEGRGDCAVLRFSLLESLADQKKVFRFGFPDPSPSTASGWRGSAAAKGAGRSCCEGGSLAAPSRMAS